VPTEPIANALARRDFNILHLNVTAPTAAPIATIPTALVNVQTLNPASASLTRIVRLHDTTFTPVPGPPVFVLDNGLFEMEHINHSITVGTTEIWELQNTSTFGHPFHIHDVQFNVLTVNGATPPAVQQGWKDVVFVPSGTTTRFIARFSDYADSIHPYMYHCHILPHEDAGMMGQFTVTAPVTARPEATLPALQFRVYPNPTTGRLFVEMAEPGSEAHYVRIFSTTGRTLRMLPSPDLRQGLDVSALPPGVYVLEVTERGTYRTQTQRFVVQ